MTIRFEDKNILVIANLFPSKDNSFYGGIFVKEQVNELARYFNRVYIISPKPFGSNRALVDYEYRNVRVFFPRFFHVPVSYFRRMLGESFFKAALRVIQRENLKFDIIHAHFTWPSGYAAVKLGKEFKVPVVVTAHGDDVRIPLTDYIRSFDNSFLRKMLDVTVSNAGLIVTHHEELFDLLIEHYTSVFHKIKFVYKGIDVRRFDPFSCTLKEHASRLKQKLGLQNKFVVLFLSRVDWDKGPLVFVEAAKLLKYNPNIAFVMVGSGSLLKKCREIKSKHRLQNLYLLGGRSDTEIWYALSDVFVALSPVENIWSTTLQEAFCMGLPTIATNVGYTSKILRDHIDALLIPPDDPESLADAILRLMNDQELRERLSKNALKWREKFDIATTITEILKLYGTILKP